jgi:hypothetical protein
VIRFAFPLETVRSTIKWPLITVYNDVYDEHLCVFAAGMSYYFVLSLFPLPVSMASLLERERGLVSNYEYARFSGSLQHLQKKSDTTSPS